MEFMESTWGVPRGVPRGHHGVPGERFENTSGCIGKIWGVHGKFPGQYLRSTSRVSWEAPEEYNRATPSEFRGSTWGVLLCSSRGALGEFLRSTSGDSWGAPWELLGSTLRPSLWSSWGVLGEYSARSFPDCCLGHSGLRPHLGTMLA